ncbi:hypothetical protein TB2_028834 [Malus domestica]
MAMKNERQTCKNLESNLGNPICPTVSDPKRLPSNAASGTVKPLTSPATNPPRKLSPAPVGSTWFVGKGPTSTSPSPQ